MDPPGGELPPGWTKGFSRSQNRPFFHHAETNTSLWTIKEVIDWEAEKYPKTVSAAQPSTHPREETNAYQESTETKQSSTDDSPAAKKLKPSAEQEGTRVAIIVPFRDLDPKQKRKAHLEQFAPYMNQFLGSIDGVQDHKVFVIEQSDDDRKFNRGKLLNLGFILARNEGFNVFVFHDVDLLPQTVISKWYLEKPAVGHPIHIARCWSRYNQSKTYLGGIVSFCSEDFERIDGFPNLYWGWGGEDDELSKRVSTAGLTVVGPERTIPNAVVDLEEMSLDQKLQWLRENREVKCNIKWEVNDEHDKFRNATPKPKWWGLSGIGQEVNILSRDDARFPKCSVVTVDVGLNYDENGQGHWTNTGTVPPSATQSSSNKPPRSFNQHRKPGH